MSWPFCQYSRTDDEWTWDVYGGSDLEYSSSHKSLNQALAWVRDNLLDGAPFEIARSRTVAKGIR